MSASAERWGTLRAEVAAVPARPPWETVPIPWESSSALGRIRSLLRALRRRGRSPSSPS